MEAESTPNPDERPEVSDTPGRAEVVDGLECPECKTAGKSTVKKNLAGLNSHRSSQHGVRAIRHTAKARDEPPGNVWGAVRGAAGELNQGSTRPPSTDELNKALGRLVTTASLAAASFFAETDPRLEASDEAIDDMVESLAFSSDEADEVTYPLARLIGRSRLNRRAGRMIVDNVEIGQSAAVLLTAALRWRRFLRERKAAIAAATPAKPVDARSVQQVPAEQPNPFSADAPPPVDDRVGVLATPATVDQIRRQTEGQR